MPKYTYDHPRPAVSADCVILTWDRQQLKLLLVQRGNPPFQGHWALPGGFVDETEDLSATPARELAEETGLCNVRLQQLHTFGDRNRDPRGRVITVAYLGMVPLPQHPLTAGDDAAAARWFPWQSLPELAFDHREIVNLARQQMRMQLRCRPFGWELLPDEFRLEELQSVYESILEHALDSAAFRSQIENLGLVVASDQKPGHYLFDLRQVRQTWQQGLVFHPLPEQAR